MSREGRITTLDLAKLSTLRDELKLQAHLFDSEMTRQWEKVEKDWSLVQGELKTLAPEASRTLYRSARATGRLLRKVQERLERIRDGLARNHQAVS